MPLLYNIGFVEIDWIDVIDILLVSFLLYQLYKLIKGSGALRIAIGLAAIYCIYWLTRALEMELLSAILGQFIGVGMLAGIILFQPEIRKFLLMVGKSAFLQNSALLRGFFKQKASAHHFNITPVLDACKILAGQHTGGLIVLAKNSNLKEIAESGDIIDATVSKRLLLSIFNKHSPLHDGAAIIASGRLVAARCMLPMSQSLTLKAQFGMRHRAALGLSEETDAVVLVVSEETGQMSLAYNGVLEHNLSIVELRTKINYYLFEAREASEAVRYEEALT